MHEKNRRKLKKKLNQKNIENAIEFFIAEESLFKWIPKYEPIYKDVILFSSIALYFLFWTMLAELF